MSLARQVQLGAPGVYPLPAERVRAFTGERMDVCAFVGIAPRGPCREPLVDHTAARDDSWRMADPDRPRRRTVPVAVESFEAYARLFGGAEGPFAGPGLLPHAVSAFFEQGGRRAYVARIVHAYDGPGDEQGCAKGLLAGVAGAVALTARSEGTWGDRLQARIAWTTRPISLDSGGLDHLLVREREPVEGGDLLRLRLAGGATVFRFVMETETFGDPFDEVRRKRCVFDAPVPSSVIAAEAVEGALTLTDGAGGRETHEALGMHSAHRRWMGTVLARESRFVSPDWAWAGAQVLPLALHLPEVEPPQGQFSGGEDRYVDLVLSDLFDPAWVSPADSEADGAVVSGIQALATLPDLTHIVVPDLYQPASMPAAWVEGPQSLAVGVFAPCFDLPPPTPPTAPELAAPGLALDPRLPGDLALIVEQQKRLVAFVEATREQIALIDVPPGLTAAAAQVWRGHFNSAYAAAYHPWPDLVREDDSAVPTATPPSAIAAGVIADQERRLGVMAGPANVLARQAVRLDQHIPAAAHARLHPDGINVFAMEDAGVRLTGARTLSRDRDWRQLSVRRLMLMLRRALKRQMDWAVFEPNGAALRRDLQRTLSTYLRRLYVAGAFRGDGEAQAFFVRCDETNNPQARVNAGMLLVEIGVAPVEPLEFILLRIVRNADGALTLEDRA